MRSEFNSIVPKRSAKADRKFGLPVAGATLEVFVCRPLNGVRLTRKSCMKIASNPPTIGPCARCEVGASHKRGRLPGTWPDGSAIVTLRIKVGAPLVARSQP